MKKVLHIGFTILSMLILVSCYMPVGEQLTLEITDLGTLYNDEQKHVIRMECSNPYASVYYRTDGTRPDSSYESKYYDNLYRLSDGQYVYGVTVPSGSEIVAIAVMSGYRNSEYCSFSVDKSSIGDIRITDHGTYLNDSSYKIIEFTCPANDVMFYYTTDDSFPSDYNSRVYYPRLYLSYDNTYQYGVLVKKGAALSVTGKKAGYDDSYAYYYVSGSLSSVATPSIIDHGAYYSDNSYNVIEISCSTPGATIRYTTDGIMPYYYSKEYSNNKGKYKTFGGDYHDGILVSKGKTVKAIGLIDGYSDSDVESLYVNGYSKSINLNSQWRAITDSAIEYDSAMYTAYESYSNHNIGGEVARMSIAICGYSDFSFMVMSDAESAFDYVRVYDIDSVSSIHKITRGMQNEWIAVDFNNISLGSHTITIDYIKDGSTNNGRDRGFILIPNN